MKFLSVLDQCLSEVTIAPSQLHHVKQPNPEEKQETGEGQAKQRSKHSERQVKAMREVLFRILASFSFKFNMMKTRLLSRGMRNLVEQNSDLINPERLFFHSFKPGYVFPETSNKIVRLANKCHLFFFHYFPQSHHWLFNHILGKELYVVFGEINMAKFAQNAAILKGQHMKYLKLTNAQVSTPALNLLVRNAERICMKNVVFGNIPKEVVRSQCKYITMKGCSNMQNLDHTYFRECEQANLVRCELLKDTLSIFGDKLKVLTLRRTFSVDNIVAQHLALSAEFRNLKVLDLSYNQIELQGFLALIQDGSVFCPRLQKLSLERNLIVSSLKQVVEKLSLLSLKYLDLNLNQIDWEEDWVRRQGFHVVRKHREKKLINEEVIKVRSVDVAVDEHLQVKLMSTDEMFKY